jgi:hypothetical protein
MADCETIGEGGVCSRRKLPIVGTKRQHNDEVEQQVQSKHNNKQDKHNQTKPKQSRTNTTKSNPKQIKSKANQNQPPTTNHFQIFFLCIIDT